MLYQIGPVTLDTLPMGPTAVSRSYGADLAAKAVIGKLQPREFMGEADSKISISGTALPTKFGGEALLASLKALSTSGTKVPVMRGDGLMLGWYMIENVSEQHKDLTAQGVGFVLTYSIELVQVDTDGALGSAIGGGVVGMLLSLFEDL